jgi:hypothetical protein
LEGSDPGFRPKSPLSKQKLSVREDLESEIQLRGIAVPYEDDEVTKALNEFWSKMAEHFEKLKQDDPEAYRFANEQIMRDMSKYRKRPRS